MTTAVALAVHIFGAVIWVGGMFAIYVCLRPALGTLDPPQRLRLMRVTFQKFFLWVWVDDDLAQPPWQPDEARRELTKNLGLPTYR